MARVNGVTIALLWWLLAVAAIASCISFPFRVESQTKDILPEPAKSPTATTTAVEWTKGMIRDRVLKEFGPEMAKVVACESGFRQFKNGKVLVSPTNDWGIFQIQFETWKKEADRLGIDFATVDGNFAMAHVVLERQGFNAWVCHWGM